VIVFTGGIGENGVAIRTVVCDGLAELGIELDATANAAAEGECEVGAAGSRTRVWVIPTNEELIVARQAFDLIRG
jgi:acetate kinase